MNPFLLSFQGIVFHQPIPTHFPVSLAAKFPTRPLQPPTLWLPEPILVASLKTWPRPQVLDDTTLSQPTLTLGSHQLTPCWEEATCLEVNLCLLHCSFKRCQDRIIPNPAKHPVSHCKLFVQNPLLVCLFNATHIKQLTCRLYVHWPT